MSRRRLTKAFPAAVVAAVVAAVLAAGQPAAAVPDLLEPRAVDRISTPVPAQPGDGASRWERPAESVTATPTSVVAEAAPRADEDSPLRVVSVVATENGPQVHVDRVVGRSDAVAAVAEAQDAPGTVAVSIDSRVAAVGLPRTVVTGGADTYRSEQWALDRLDAEKVWRDGSGSGAVVAVLDTGVDGSHPDLAGRLTATGYDFVGGGDPRTDPSAQSHGTHVAGIVAAVQGNSKGVAGLAPDARIMPVRVLDANGSGWTSNITKGIIHAVDNGADVVNLSLGGPQQDPATAKAVDYARSRGVLVVAAAGNDGDGQNATTYPAALPGVLAVGSTNSNDSHSTFSNTGDYVDISAPGGRILSTVAGGYTFMSGTSMATPYVSAVAALAAGATGGTATADQLERALTSTATDLGAAGRDPVFGAGLVSASGTLCRFTVCDGVQDAPQPVAQPQPEPESQPVPTPELAPELTTAPLPGPEPEPSPAPETEPAPTPSPGEAEPAPARRRVIVSFRSRGGTVTHGESRVVRGHLAFASDGLPARGRPLLLVGRRDGRVVLRRALTTDRRGNAAVTLVLRATTRFVLRSPLTPLTLAATSAESIRWRVVR